MYIDFTLKITNTPYTIFQTNCVAKEKTSKLRRKKQKRNNLPITTLVYVQQSYIRNYKISYVL